jgi:O-antigen/teichoic acid export membrane protein
MASRTRNFIHALGAGYVAIAVNIAYTVTSVPLALHYLGNEQFGLWALAQQIVGYLMLLDLGVSSAVSRFIADRKDEVNSGSYGSLVLTGAIVFAIQGGLIAIAGVAFSFFAPALFAVPDHLAGEFANVLTIITSLAGVSVALRTLGAPLWAFQRMDVSYGLGSLTLLTSFAALWAGFHLGWGIYSFAFAGIPAAILCPIITFLICWKSGFYPSAGHWGRPNFPLFRKIFSFGQDVVLVALGSQLANASQIMVLSRVAGLDVAATFAIGTKLFTLGQQFTGKIIESSAPPLTELFVRGESANLLMRFTNVVALTTLLATIGACALMAGNTLFISFWTSGIIEWSLFFDCILAALLLITSFSRCLISLFGIASNVRPIRHIYFVEGALFIALAFPAAAYFGIGGLLSASLFAHFVITCTLSLRACGRVLTSLQPIVRSGLVSIAITLFIALLSFFTIKPPNHVLASIFRLAFLVSLASFMSWFLILTPVFRSELRSGFLAIANNIRSRFAGH